MHGAIAERSQRNAKQFNYFFLSPSNYSISIDCRAGILKGYKSPLLQEKSLFFGFPLMAFFAIFASSR
jgi:hypothetical protein